MKLIPMNQAEFEEYLAWAIPSYAEHKVQAGNLTENDALEKAKAEFDGYLPQGLDTPNHYLFCILNDSGQKIGWFWFGSRENNNNHYIYVYDVKIFEQYQRRNYGEQVFLLLEQKTKELGLNEIRLHVFGYNHPARNLYEKLGYETTNIHMRKKLGN